MQPAAIIERRLEWADTDAAGVMYNGALWRYVEAAEEALHDRLGIREHTFGATPRVRVSAQFVRPLRFHDLMRVELTVAAVGRTSITYRFAITCDAQPAVDGEIVSVLIDRSTGVATPWPQQWRDLLTGGAPQPGPA